MAINLKGCSLMRIADLSVEEFNMIIESSITLKNNSYAGVHSTPLKGKMVAGLFEKNSTRTRTATDFAANLLGAGCSYIDSSGSNMGSKESVVDTAIVLGRMYDGILYRCMRHDDCQAFADHSGISIINGLSEKFHPTQMLADIMTICEHTGKNVHSLRGDKLVYLGNPNNMSNSYIETCGLLGMDCTIIAPMALHQRWEEYYKEVKTMFEKSNATLVITDDVNEISGANYITTDAWVDLGEDMDTLRSRIELLRPYQVNMELIKATNVEHPYFLHCLPAMHDQFTTVGKIAYDEFNMEGIEVTNEVFQSSHSIVFDEAENRKWTIAALFNAML